MTRTRSSLSSFPFGRLLSVFFSFGFFLVRWTANVVFPCVLEFASSSNLVVS